MKKAFLIIAVILIIVVVCGALSACNYETTPNACIESGGTFAIIYERNTANTVYVEMYDKETKVMYVYIKLSDSGSITPLYNEDGTLKLYKESE